MVNAVDPTPPSMAVHSTPKAVANDHIHIQQHRGIENQVAGPSGDRCRLFPLGTENRRRGGFRPESSPRGVTSTRSAGRTVKPNPHHVSIFKFVSVLSCLGELERGILEDVICDLGELH